MLVNRPKKVICKVGEYNIIVSSDKTLEDEEKFNQFCIEFTTVLKLMVGQANRPAEDKIIPAETVPTVAHEGVS